jgi:hypothetical protein
MSWNGLCKENQKTQVSANTLVRYGVRKNWVLRVVSGYVVANNQLFGDPAPGVVKELQQAIFAGNSPDCWCFVDTEYSVVTVPPGTRVRYGIDGNWVEREMSGKFVADNNTFGDPAPGKEKQLQVRVVTDEFEAKRKLNEQAIEAKRQTDELAAKLAASESKLAAVQAKHKADELAMQLAVSQAKLAASQAKLTASQAKLAAVETNRNAAANSKLAGVPVAPRSNPAKAAGGRGSRCALLCEEAHRFSACPVLCAHRKVAGLPPLDVSRNACVLCDNASHHFRACKQFACKEIILKYSSSSYVSHVY